MSSEQKSKDAHDLFVDGIADWVSKEPTVRSQMILTFGLFSMPPGGINKQPNVDYHVWMDQQLNVVANHPTLTGLAGINWWTLIQNGRFKKRIRRIPNHRFRFGSRITG